MLDRRQFLQSTALLANAATGAEPAPLAPSELSRWGGELSFTLNPPAPAWTASSPGVYLAGDYRLELHFEHPEPELLNLRFRLTRHDAAAFEVIHYSLRARTPFIGTYRLWTYRSGPMELHAEFDSYTRGIASGDKFAQTLGANSGIPMVVATDREGRNRFTFGLLDQVEATGLRIRGYSLGLAERAEGLNYLFEFERPTGYKLTRTALEDGARFDTRPLSWFDAVAQHSAWVESALKLAVLKPPPSAWEPIWNTWYPFGQNFNEKTIRENAAFCRQAGITTLCIDAGYNNSLTGGMGTAADIDLFNAHTGDWTADPGKFPAFDKNVAEWHAQGHKVTVWVALFIVGRATRAYPAVKHMLIHSASGDERIHLCPCHPETPAYLARTFLALARAYDLDGFWLDFMDGLHEPCHARHPHATASTGEGYNRCLAAVRDAVLQWKPGFLIETRMKMANLNVKQFANVLETTDMPFDFDINRSLGVHLRAFSAGVAAKLDPAQWHLRESNENVAKSCATVTFAGVPVFGVDFRLLPASHVDVVAAWMRFYRRHQAFFTAGRLQPEGFTAFFPQFSVRAENRLYLYAGSASTAPVDAAGCDQIYIANAADSPRLCLTLDRIAQGQWNMEVQDCFLKPKLTAELSIRRRNLNLDEPVPEGGMLVLKHA